MGLDIYKVEITEFVFCQKVEDMIGRKYEVQLFQPFNPHCELRVLCARVLICVMPVFAFLTLTLLCPSSLMHTK